MRVHYEILNQKGTPAFYSDTYINRPTYGFAGRVFISTDTGQIFEDTGLAWSLIADAGVGGGTLGSVCANGNSTSAGIIITAGGLSSNSITNTSLTTGSILFADAGGLESQNNTKLYWDNTNFRLGIGNNSPGAPLDIHATGTNAHFNGTGTNNAYLVFQNAGTSKWRIGNTYNAGANSFDIYNNGLANTPLSINSATNLITLSANVTTTGIQAIQNGLNLGYASGGATASYTNMSGSTTGINFALANGTGGASFIFPTAAGYNYTFPATTGTLALTSNLSSYLPLTGGTLTGQLYINPTNTATTGLDVASDNISFRSDNLEGSKRQLLITMGSGTLIQFTAQGYGANYGTDLAFYTATTSGVNASPAIYITGTNNRVGIKTGTPSYDLDVLGTGRYTGTLSVQSAGSTQLFLLSTGASSRNWQFQTSEAENGDISLMQSTAAGGSTYARKFNITSGGNVGINCSSSNKKLYCQSDDATSSSFAFGAQNGVDNLFLIRGDGLINTGLRAYSPYNFSTSGRSAIINSSGELGYLVSTRESKANIKSIENVDFINQLNPVLFNYRKKDSMTNIFTDELYENTTYGFIADEVEKVNKELVFYNEDGTLAGVEYNSMIAILTKAIQELNEKLVRNNIN